MSDADNDDHDVNIDVWFPATRDVSVGVTGDVDSDGDVTVHKYGICDLVISVGIRRRTYFEGFRPKFLVFGMYRKF